MRMAALVAMLMAGGAQAGGLAGPVGGVVVVTEPGDLGRGLEIVRHERDRIGRDTAVSYAGRVFPSIEWRRPVEVRARTESGRPMSEAERAFVRDRALACGRGAVLGVEELLERNGTWVLEFDCAWLQGFEGRVSVAAQ